MATAPQQARGSGPNSVDSATALKETFVHFTGGSVSFSVVDGKWKNQQNGFFRGIQTICSVTDLSGYTGPSSACT